MTVIHNFFSATMRGFRDNEVLLPTGYDVIVSPLPGVAVRARFHEGFWKIDYDFLVAFHRNFLTAMHGFRDKEVLLQALRQGALHALFHDGFWKSGHDFLIVIHSKVLSGMHDFRDNEVILPTWYDVIMTSPLGGVLHRFCWWNRKERRQFHYQVSLTYFAYLLPFRSYSTFYFGW